MLATIREGQDKVKLAKNKPDIPIVENDCMKNEIEETKFLMERALEEEKKNLNEEFEKSSDGGFVITRTTPQFGDVFTSQEETLKKTIGEAIDFGEKGLVFYPSTHDLVLNGKIKSMNVAFQFRYSDPSGIGCYLWANGFQMTDENTRTLGKIRDAFTNWKQSLIQNGDLLDKLGKVASKQTNTD